MRPMQLPPCIATAAVKKHKGNVLSHLILQVDVK